MLDTTGQVGTPYSSSISVLGSEPHAVEITGGALPDGLSFSGASLSGTPSASGAFYFQATVSNLCGSDSNWYGILISDKFDDFVWGDSWSYTMPQVPGATFYVEHISAYPGSYDVSIPQAYAYNPVGPYSLQGRNYSGITNENSPLGPTRVWVDGWSSVADYYGVNVGVSVDVTVNTYFRIYWGDWEGPLPAEFTDIDILGLTHGGVAGPSTRLCATARNQELQFSALESAKYRIIAIPYHLAAGGPPGPAGKGINSIRSSDHTQSSLVPSPDTPYGDPQVLLLNNVYHFVYVVNSTASATSVWLRFAEQAVHGYSYGSTATPWSQSFSISQIDPAVAELISVEVTMNTSWQGSLWFENTSTLGTRTLTADLSTLSVLRVGGADALQGTTTSNFAPPTLSAFDGALNYDGTSGYMYTTRFGSDSSSVSLASGDDSFSGFVGTGAVELSIDSTHSVAVNPVAGISDPETLSISVFNNKTLVAGYVTLTYFKT